MTAHGLRLRQGKTGRRVNIPVTRRLRAVLENTKRTSTVILTNKRGMAWQQNAFRKAWGDACRKAEIIGLTFHDLRGTAVTRLAEAECSQAEIAPHHRPLDARRGRDPRHVSGAHRQDRVGGHRQAGKGQGRERKL